MNLQKAIDLEAVYLKNVSELIYLEEIKGYYLQRFPTKMLESIKHDFNFNKPDSYYDSTGCEISWYTTSADESEIILITLDTICNVAVFVNNKKHSYWNVTKGNYTKISLKITNQYKEYLQSTGDISLYHWRIIFGKGAKAVISSIKIHMANISKQQNKRHKWVAYGSSISHGSGSNFINQSFLHIAAEKLGYDILNKSVSGISFIEPQVADYIASLSSNAVVSLELGLNMIGKYKADVFEERVKYLLDSVLASNPAFIIVITPILCHYCLSGSSKKASWDEYSNILKEICKTKYSSIQLIDGADLVNNFDLLQIDLLHPSSEGHYIMGNILLEQISEKIKLAL